MTSPCDVTSDTPNGKGVLRRTMSGQIQCVLASAVQPVMRMPIGRRMVPGTSDATISGNELGARMVGGFRLLYVV